MAGFFDRLLRGLGWKLPEGTVRFRFPRESGAHDPQNQPIIEDFVDIALSDHKLGQDAILYLLTGAPDTVPTRLAARPDLCKIFLGRHDLSQARGAFFLETTPCNIGLLARYGEILAAAHQVSPGPYQLFGPDTVDLRLRLILSFAINRSFVTPVASPASRPGLSLLALGQLIRRLGQPEEVIHDLVFWQPPLWLRTGLTNYLARCEMTEFLRRNESQILARAASWRSDAKAELIALLDKHGLCGTGPYAGFVLDAAGGTAKGMREAAMRALTALPRAQFQAQIEPLARTRQETGDKAMREGMKALLQRIGARAPQSPDPSPPLAAAGHYIALDGSRVELPPLDFPPDEPWQRVGPEWDDALLAAVRAQNAKAETLNAQKQQNRWHKHPIIHPPEDFVRGARAFLDTGVLPKGIGLPLRPDILLKEHAPDLLERIEAQLPLARSLMRITGNPADSWTGLAQALATMPSNLRAWLEGPKGDLRVLDDHFFAVGKRIERGTWPSRSKGVWRRGDLLSTMLQSGYFRFDEIELLPVHALWPLVAAHLDLVETALRPSSAQEPMDRMAALRLVQVLPKVPLQLLEPLIDIAVGEGKSGRQEAQDLLAQAEGLDARLVALLSDGRQAARAGAAQFLGHRGTKAAIPDLLARAKRETSDLARAAILTALRRLDADISGLIGPEALVAEAAKGLKSAKRVDLSWLPPLPALQWADGSPLPQQVLDWWMHQAIKLKQPGGNGLVELQLDQLAPGSAERLSTFLFSAWIDHDTRQVDEETAAAEARALLPRALAHAKKAEPEATEQIIFDRLRRRAMSVYLNSGIETKGLLALATRVPPLLAASRVRQVLKLHGSRTSQAIALLELLAAKGDPLCLQVLIGAARRSKQKSLQARARDLISALADRRGWTAEELADRTIPTGGLDEDGVLELPCGPDARIYRARLGDALTLVLTNPEGRPVQALPGGDDETTEAARQQLSASRKEIRQVVAAQTLRLYEAMCIGRIWTFEDWQRDIAGHPVMARLIQGLIWDGLDDADRAISFRPTPEGDCIGLDDLAVDPAAFARLRLGHPALGLDPGWAQALKDYEVKQPFDQLGRPLRRARAGRAITDHEGCLLDNLGLRSAANRLGYERGPAEDGYYTQYVKHFSGLVAVVGFSGAHLGDTGEGAVGLESLTFCKPTARGLSQPIPLDQVPPALLSEAWNDYRDISAKGKKGQA